MAWHFWLASSIPKNSPHKPPGGCSSLEWLPTLARKGLALVPVSAVVQHQMSREQAKR